MAKTYNPMNKGKHWDDIYQAKAADSVGWYTPHLETSLAWIESLKLSKTDSIIDVGGGASTLVDDLIDADYQNIAVADLSATAIQLCQRRLGDLSNQVTWMQGDVLQLDLGPAHYRLWHDRAVFHFLIDAEARAKYRAILRRALAMGGFFLIGAFAPEAPPRCSGLPVQRYDVESLQTTFADGFELMRHHSELHVTPSGTEQPYVYCLLRKVR